MLERANMLHPLLEIVRNLGDGVSSPPEVSGALLQAVPDELSLEHIRNLTAEVQDASDTPAVLSVIYAVLKSNKLGHLPDDVDDDAEFGATLEEVALRLGQMIEPVCSGATYDEDSTDYAALSRNGLLGLHIIEQLLALAPRGRRALPTKTLLSVVAFTNASDAWSSGPCAELARSLLENYCQEVVSAQAPLLAHGLSREPEKGGRRPVIEKATNVVTERESFITEDILTGFLRPLFAKSRPATVTATGRAAAFPEQPSRYAQGDDFGIGQDAAIKKPWKYTRQYAVTVFEWAVENATTELLQRHWHLYTPILLTLLDEPQPISLKLRSLSIFRNFWRIAPDGLFSRTGLAEIFEQAVFPTVLSLPDLTPETESLALLGAAYPALFDMAGLEWGPSPVGTAKVTVESATNHEETGSRHAAQSKGFSDTQRKLLDKIFREGIMVGYHHAKGHVRLVEFFCYTLSRLIKGAGILSVKYLKDIIPMTSEILIDPFGTKYPPVLIAATLLLQAVLQSCWPRVPHYYNEIVKIAMLSWLNIEDDTSFPPGQPTREELKQRITRTVEILLVVMKAADRDVSDSVRLLVTKEPRLHPIFANWETAT